MKGKLDERRNERLVEAVVDRERVGDRWAEALVMLIEAHEKLHSLLVTRKEAHILMERYAGRYFPHDALGYEERRAVFKLLRARYLTRQRAYLQRTLRAH